MVNYLSFGFLFENNGVPSAAYYVDGKLLGANTARFSEIDGVSNIYAIL